MIRREKVRSGRHVQELEPTFIVASDHRRRACVSLCVRQSNQKQVSIK